jgi:hypothetical protein
LRTFLFGFVAIRFDPQAEHRSRSAMSDTAESAGRTSQLTTASRPHASQRASTERTPFSRMLARFMGTITLPSAL